jgi:predicted O-methyltransferase YrrM
MDDQPGMPTGALVDLALRAAAAAQRTDLAYLGERLNGRFSYPDNLVNVWPGEHYRLLSGLVTTLEPSLVVEIGTAEGLSALSMLHSLRPGARLVSFDLVDWKDYPRSCLREEDFTNGVLEQRTEDASRPSFVSRNENLLSEADLIFIDAAKDGVMERVLLGALDRCLFKRRPIIVLDDIRLWNMIAIWRELGWPKVDITSFGHWCGTGLCQPNT